jgi:methionyl-tRNA synthetase
MYRFLIGYLKPVLPHLAAKSEQFLNVDIQWSDLSHPQALPAGHKINTFKPLIARIEKESIEKMIEESTQVTEAVAKDPIAPEITIEEFARLDLRVARIVSAQHVEGADKLLQLTLDLGEATGNLQKTVFAGIKSAYAPAQLEGKLVVMLANLKPRKMRFGLSEGMLLAAGAGGDELFVLHPDQGAKPGMRIK